MHILSSCISTYQQWEVSAVFCSDLWHSDVCFANHMLELCSIDLSLYLVTCIFTRLINEYTLQCYSCSDSTVFCQLTECNNPYLAFENTWMLWEWLASGLRLCMGGGGLWVTFIKNPHDVLIVQLEMHPGDLGFFKCQWHKGCTYSEISLKLWLELPGH